MDIPNDFYTAATLFSLSGSSTAVLIITSVIGYLLEPKDSRSIKKWVGLFLSIVLALLGVTQLKETETLTWVVAIVNGFLIYLTAVGANTIIAHVESSKESSQSPLPTSRAHRCLRKNFTDSWWK